MAATASLVAIPGVLRAPAVDGRRADRGRARSRAIVTRSAARRPSFGRGVSPEPEARESRQHGTPLNGPAPGVQYGPHPAPKPSSRGGTKTNAVPLGFIVTAGGPSSVATSAVEALATAKRLAEDAARRGVPGPRVVASTVLTLPKPNVVETDPSLMNPGIAPEFAESTREPGSVVLVDGSSRLWLTEDGRVNLRRWKRSKTPGGMPTETTVSTAHVQLPKECIDVPGTFTRTVRDDDGNVIGAEIRWGVVARLRIEAAASRCFGRDAVDDWSAKLAEGFVAEFSVNAEACVEPEHAMAEFKVDVDAAGDWFGGGHLMKQHWPLNLGCWEVGPHYPFDNGPNGINTLVATHWVTSTGLAVLVDPDTPYLHVGLNAPKPRGAWDSLVSNRSFGVGIQNATRLILPMKQGEREGDGVLRLQARAGFHKGRGAFTMDHPMIGWEAESSAVVGSVDEGLEPGYEDESQWLSMRVGMLALDNVKHATEACLRTLKKPTGAPPSEVIRAPIWTTWARYKQNVDQRKTLTFAREILENKLPRSVMEIDDKWQSGYGELDFDPFKFPDPKGMVDELHAMGFKVTLWVMPFVEEDTDAYREGKPLGYFVESDHSHHPFDAIVNGMKPGFFKWWNSPPVVALDVTNPAAVEWFVGRLESLQTRYGIDGYKFDAGEPCFLPRHFRTHTSLTHPSEYTRCWVQNVAARFELAEVRTGHHTTGTSTLTRMGDRFSDWGTGNGLRSIIPTLLTSGITGYPFCLPDMIGGNAYFGKFPDRELMVRWAQANALMPALQFSLAPWDVGAEAADLTRKSLEIREKVVETLVHLTEAAAHSLEPMCRPMWWLAPEDENTYRIQDQFAVGNDVIVAPVVTKGVTKRDVYLTEGLWVEASDPTGKVFVGGQWTRDFLAPLEKLPCFMRVAIGEDEYCDVGDLWEDPGDLAEK